MFTVFYNKQWYNTVMAKRRKPILATDYPLIAAEWDTGANKNVDPGASPQSISANSPVHYWWRCSHGHPSWLATPAYRTRFQQYGCPYCGGRKAIPGETDLATLFPELAKEYAADLNDAPVNTIKPEDKHNYWWRCSLGHTWQAAPNTRTKKHTRCRYCANRYAWPGFNDLASKFPDIAAEFDVEKNDTTADHVVYNSHHVMWWKCDKGHSWCDDVRARTERHTRCPQCHGVYKGYGNRLIPGVNDLLSAHPELREYWNEPTYDNTLPNSNKKYQWKCPKGHTWLASPNSLMSSTKDYCPYCSNSRVWSGFNDLQTLFPDIAKEWDADKNKRPASQALPFSNKRVWWKCAAHGHSWSSPMNLRTTAKNATGCPYCSNHRILVGFNDLATTNPELAKEWDTERNGGLTPKDVVAGTDRKVWWRCAKGHEWKAGVYSRSNRKMPTGCPECAAAETSSRGEIEVRDYITSLLPTGTEVLANDRTAIAPKELDVYVPSLAIAVEYDGIYWHTTIAGRGRDYHHDKWEQCRKRGIRLIQIWEDEWRDRRPIVEDMLQYVLHAGDQIRIGARTCAIDADVPRADADAFMNANHIQGRASASLRFGLRSADGSLAAVMLMARREDGSYLLTRYATTLGTSVVGGFTRLLSHMRDRIGEHGRIITFSDHRVSDGGLYKSNGFRQDLMLPPDYYYVNGVNREHKFNYRKARFKSNPELRYEEGLTETQLARINGLERVYDSGKTRWLLDW
jgi:cytochrome c2